MLSPQVRAGTETHRDHSVLHKSFKMLTREALARNGQLLHACAALRREGAARVGARLQDLAGHQVLDDLAEQLYDLAVTQRGERHARTRQQEVARQDRDLAACCTVSRVSSLPPTLLITALALASRKSPARIATWPHHALSAGYHVHRFSQNLFHPALFNLALACAGVPASTPTWPYSLVASLVPQLTSPASRFAAKALTGRCSCYSAVGGADAGSASVAERPRAAPCCQRQSSAPAGPAGCWRCQ